MISETLLFEDIDIHEVISEYSEKFKPDEIVDCSTPDHIATMFVYEKYFFRTSTDVGCIVAFNQKTTTSLEITIIVAGGGQGLRNRDFWGSKKAMMKRMTHSIKPFTKTKAN